MILIKIPIVTKKGEEQLKLFQDIKLDEFPLPRLKGEARQRGIFIVFPFPILYIYICVYVLCVRWVTRIQWRLLGGLPALNLRAGESRSLHPVQDILCMESMCATLDARPIRCIKATCSLADHA